MIVRDASEMPTLGPETLDLLFRLGCLTTYQLRALLPVCRSESQVRRITHALIRSGMVSSARRPYRYGRAFLASLVDAGGEPGAGDYAGGGTRTKPTAKPTAKPGRWVTIYFLTEDGLSLVARDRDLYPSVARSLYGRVLDDARVYHALLRNEFYAWLKDDIRAGQASGPPSGSPSGPPPTLTVETMCAESGYTPIRLADGDRGKARYLNPDGVLELSDARAPEFYERVMIESDTGSQDMPWQIKQKAEKLGEHLLMLLDSHAAGAPANVPLELPGTLFVSPTFTRMRWVREVFREDAADPASVLAEARRKVMAADPRRPDVAAGISFTNLQWLIQHGTLGRAYWPLSSNERTPLLPAV